MQKPQSPSCSLELWEVTERELHLQDLDRTEADMRLGGYTPVSRAHPGPAWHSPSHGYDVAWLRHLVIDLEETTESVNGSGLGGGGQWARPTLRSAGAILLVRVPATIMTSDWRGLARKTTPKRSMS